jgi:hypothetical protein
MDLRSVVWLVGLIVMVIALVLPLVPSTEPRGWFTWAWLWSVGATILLAAHGWPDSFS